eukprot:TRINITY_DN1554_c0_g1_i3.p1 TRINITY_DN1554_c0_g1~~TRINITY_DN1554_c0_g1_i3.p1  ORF type:complete len:307 (-),score=61.31 TRINITY_DN1554_c0_g1_i3:61-981(-)
MSRSSMMNLLVSPHLAACPATMANIEYFQYPSIVITFSFFALVSLVFGLVITFKFNSVKVFYQNIRTPIIANTKWILFYFALFARCVCTALDYAFFNTPQKNWVGNLYILSVCLHGLVALLLSVALNHQRKYRSSAGFNDEDEDDQDATRLSTMAARYWPEILFGFLFLYFLVFFFLQLANLTSELYLYLFLTAFGLQRLPVLALVLIICLQPNSADGPTKYSKTLLAVGAVFNLTNDLPLNIWARILPGGCPFVVAGWVDFVHLLYFISLVFFFLFIRAEFTRNEEETIWKVVKQIQDTFDFRRF